MGLNAIHATIAGTALGLGIGFATDRLAGSTAGYAAGGVAAVAGGGGLMFAARDTMGVMSAAVGTAAGVGLGIAASRLLGGGRDAPSPALLGTYELESGGRASVSIGERVGQTFDTRLEAFQSPKPDGELALVGTQMPGSDTATWQYAPVSITDEAGNRVPFDLDQIYDDVIKRDDDGTIEAHSWQDQPGDGMQLAGIFGPPTESGNSGVLVAMPGEEQLIDVHATELPTGS